MKPLLFRYEFRRSHLEAFFWLAALIALGTFTPTEEGHSTLCLIRRFDLGFCPGCGLGHSIAWLFRGNISESFHAHPMGVPAVIILIGRIINILNPIFHLTETSTMEKIYQLIPDADIMELQYLDSILSGKSEEQIKQFALVYRSRRRDPIIILVTALIGLVFVAGIHRFLLNQIGMGILYLLTGGLCMIGTIVDLINYKNLAFEYNQKVAQEILMFTR